MNIGPKQQLPLTNRLALNVVSTYIFNRVSGPEKSIVDTKLSVLKISKFYAKVEWESVKF